MLLAALGKALIVLAIGGAGYVTYQITKKDNSSIESHSLPFVREGTDGWLIRCTAPYIIKTTGGVLMSASTREQGQSYLEQYYKGQGTVEECTDHEKSE